MKPEKNRRRFFKQLLGASAAVGVLSASSSQAEKNSIETKEKNARGYHETEHIRDYYRKINF